MGHAPKCAERRFQFPDVDLALALRVEQIKRLADLFHLLLGDTSSLCWPPAARPTGRQCAAASSIHTESIPTRHSTLSFFGFFPPAGCRLNRCQEQKVTGRRFVEKKFGKRAYDEVRTWLTLRLRGQGEVRTWLTLWLRGQGYACRFSFASDVPWRQLRARRSVRCRFSHL